MASQSLVESVQKKSSRLPGFYRLTPGERRELVASWAGLEPAEAAALVCGLDESTADTAVENVVGCVGLPLGVAVNFRVNGTDVLVPMAVEEPSVVAAASHGALLARDLGGFTAEADDPIMIGQIQVVDLPRGDLSQATHSVLGATPELMAAVNAQAVTLVRLGGGARGIEVRSHPDTSVGPMLVVHVLVDTRDAMGANAVNTVCEALAPRIADLTGGRVVLRILSNLADRRLARATCRVAPSALAREGLDGAEVARRIVEANALAEVDPYRAATHNKGVMNGIDAVVVATGNDWRAAEAAAHAYAARGGEYRSLTSWRLTESGHLEGHLELPLALGTVGGGTRAFPAAAAALRLLGTTSARQLAQVAASVGLAQNLSALRALVSEGIQPGHMALHARQVALAAGAKGEEAGRVAEALILGGEIRLQKAVELLGRREPNPGAGAGRV